VLAETILQAMAQPDQNRSLVRRAFDFARKHFSEEVVVTANESILQQLLTPGPRTPK
jgi:hypothetical protein